MVGCKKLLIVLLIVLVILLMLFGTALSNIKIQAQFTEQERHINKIKLSTKLTTKDGIVIAFFDGQQ